MRGQRQHRRGQRGIVESLEDAEEEPRVGQERIDVRVGRDDDGDDPPGRTAGVGGDVQRAGAAREARQRATVVVESGACGRRTNERAKRKGREGCHLKRKRRAGASDEPGRRSGLNSLSAAGSRAARAAGQWLDCCLVLPELKLGPTYYSGLRTIFRTFSISALVEYPSSIWALTTRPPRASTMSRPTI